MSREKERRDNQVGSGQICLMFPSWTFCFHPQNYREWLLGVEDFQMVESLTTKKAS